MATSKIGKLQQQQKFVDRCWKNLDVEPAAIHRHPTITPILINALGNVGAAIQCLRGSDAKEAIELVRLWDAATDREREVIPFEGYCLAAKSTPKQMIGIVMQALVEQANIASELILAIAHTEVVQATVALAMTPEGSEERRIILQNRGVLPAPKNQVFNNYGSMTQDNRKQVANVSVGQLDMDNDKISEAVDKFNAQRVLNAGQVQKIDVLDITAEEVE